MSEGKACGKIQLNVSGFEHKTRFIGDDTRNEDRKLQLELSSLEPKTHSVGEGEAYRKFQNGSVWPRKQELR